MPLTQTIPPEQQEYDELGRKIVLPKVDLSGRPYTQSYLELLSKPPEPQQTDRLSKLLAAIAGGAAGYVERSPEKAYAVTKGLIEEPYRRDLEKWQRQVETAKAQAAVEDALAGYGLNVEKFLADQAYRRAALAADIKQKEQQLDVQAKRLNEIARHNKELEDLQRSKLSLDEKAQELENWYKKSYIDLESKKLLDSAARQRLDAAYKAAKLDIERAKVEAARKKTPKEIEEEAAARERGIQSQRVDRSNAAFLNTIRTYYINPTTRKFFEGVDKDTQLPILKERSKIKFKDANEERIYDAMLESLTRFAGDRFTIIEVK